MNKYIYIKKSAKGNFVELDNELPSEYYEIGTTFLDYLNEQWVLLSSELITFKEEHPTASVKEVWNMEMDTSLEPHIRDLNDAKQEKIAQIWAYNDSNEINDFTINSEIHTWLIPSERANYRNSIDSAKILNKNYISLYVGSIRITLTLTQAEQLLALIQSYADLCYIITKNHIEDVNALESIKAVDSFDVTVDYPEKLNFDIEV